MPAMQDDYRSGFKTFARNIEFIRTVKRTKIKLPFFWHCSFAMATESLWAAFDKSKPAAVTLAREFACVNFMAGELDRADTLLSYLLPGENQLEAQDDQPLVTRLLSSAVTYGLGTNEENRAKFADSLESRLLEQGTDRSIRN